MKFLCIHSIIELKHVSLQGGNDDDIRHLLWIAYKPRTFRQSVGCFQGVQNQTSSYYEIAPDERIRSSNSHN